MNALLSILIPTRDYTCYQLVETLQQQAERLNIDYEIIVAEDGSRSQVSIIANHKIIDLPHCLHLIRRPNVGRAAIRNVLAQEAVGQWLLYMDADGRVVREDFLEQYVEAARQHPVVCGGVQCPQVCYDPHRQLRWRYERDYERRHGRISQEFRSFCFLVHREVAEAVKFDERYTHYGYEDVKYGRDLQRAGYAIHCIDNPLENKDIEENDKFLLKTEEALRTAHHFRHEWQGEIAVVRLAERLRWLRPVARLAFPLLRHPMRSHLLSAHPRLWVFQAYKLGYYMTL